MLTKLQLTVVRPFWDKFSDYLSANVGVFSKVPTGAYYYSEIFSRIFCIPSQIFERISQESSHLFLLLIMKLEHIKIREGDQIYG